MTGNPEQEKPEQEKEATWLAGCLLLLRPGLPREVLNGTSVEAIASKYEVSAHMARFRLNTKGSIEPNRRVQGWDRQLFTLRRRRLDGLPSQTAWSRRFSVASVLAIGHRGAGKLHAVLASPAGSASWLAGGSPELLRSCLSSR
jgi:hypothetical protein